MELWGETLTFAAGFFLLLALALALSFEFVNGFHDTANAVATVIYTNTLKPTYAVVWAGTWNLFGVLFGGLAGAGVAYNIVALLPVELVLNTGTGAGFAMIFALLVSAILWNVGTWYLGLPASSSHTLIGAILGVGLANAVVAGHSWTSGINWPKAQETGMALLFSPLFGFFGAALLLLIFRWIIPNPALFTAPKDKTTPPPWWIRIILMITCTLVSFFHGSNDGQKGMGLIMLILIGLVPGAFALNSATNAATAQKTVTELRQVATTLTAKAGAAPLNHDEAVAELTAYIPATGTKLTERTFAAIVAESNFIAETLTATPDITRVPRENRVSLRTDMYLVDEAIGKVIKKKAVTEKEGDAIKGAKKSLDGITKFVPIWVMVAVALALGCGTMIGWKRIVITVGEKIGKAHLTYAQGAAAELMAAATIGAADYYHQPVSTTHVLSSGVAGTMAANGSGLQRATLINILLAWVLTLPVCIFLGASLFAAGLYVTFHVFGIR